MATKTKKTTKKPAARRATRKRKGIERAVGRHPFAPGSEVGVYEAFGLTQGREEVEPVQEPVAKAKVAKNGDLSVNVPSKGDYYVAAKVGERKVDGETVDVWRRVQISVR